MFLNVNSCSSFVVFLDIKVEGHLRRLCVRVEPQETDSQSKETQDEPSGKTKIKVEQVKLVAVHHVLAKVDRLVGREFRLIHKNVVRHRIGKGLYDPRHKKQKRPKEDEESVQEHAPDMMPDNSHHHGCLK